MEKNMKFVRFIYALSTLSINWH